MTKKLNIVEAKEELERCKDMSYFVEKYVLKRKLTDYERQIIKDYQTNQQHTSAKGFLGYKTNNLEMTKRPRRMLVTKRY